MISDDLLGFKTFGFYCAASQERINRGYFVGDAEVDMEAVRKTRELMLAMEEHTKGGHGKSAEPHKPVYGILFDPSGTKRIQSDYRISDLREIPDIVASGIK
jgi:hypothetical protein